MLHSVSLADVAVDGHELHDERNEFTDQNFNVNEDNNEDGMDYELLKELTAYQATLSYVVSLHIHINYDLI